jgi:hypothetical protein
MNTPNPNLAEIKSQLLKMAAETKELEMAIGGSITDAVGAWLAQQYLLAAREKLKATGEAGSFEVLRTFVQDWAMLRRGDQNAAWLSIEREKIDEARKDDELKALNVCLDEVKKWPDVKELFQAAFAQLKERKKGAQ